jgi:hypothetical protein
MSQPINPNARTRYSREITGTMGRLRLEAELRKFTKEMSAVAPNMDAVNRVEVSASDYAVLEKEIFGRTGTDAELAVTNPINTVRCVIKKSTTVSPGTVEFWTQYGR